MLVLTRKLDEKIQIGSDITITVVRVKGHTVQIGIEAPGQVQVLRGELAAAEDLRSEALEVLGQPASPPTREASSSERPTAHPSQPSPKKSGRRASRSVRLLEESHPRGAGVLPITVNNSFHTISDALIGFEVAFAW